MKSWIYAGVSDKHDLLLYICRLLASAGAKVLLVDGTERQIYRYSIGQADQSLPITEYCGFDVACGFFSAESLKVYLKDQGCTIEDYDFVVYDLEKLTFCDEADWRTSAGIVWVTAFERFAVERSVEWFKLLFSKYPALQDISAGIVFIRYVESLIEESYIREMIRQLPVKWDEQGVKVHWDERDYGIQLENEHNRALHIKPLSRSYKKAITALTDRMAGSGIVKTRSLFRSSARRQVWANS
ncbi:hypothetical protein [Paenibacillus physcomitrellae]|uniref:Class I SAM-dependent methyltransferase n=1 Tax=Paenibacillus physcomitrellae TaxID=1619311 RepID=A0ABQ1FRQ1_9BACL|nr:hypothetical protein [Paenibacillus physcomitrellae]GGA24990.1 hypothetical protein GCM10010917_07350 [Paenibacillus physcomitrellae]